VVSTLASIKRKPGFKVCSFKCNLYRYTEAGSLAGKLKGGTSAAGTFADSGDAPPER
jgi:hypothetical protein